MADICRCYNDCEVVACALDGCARTFRECGGVLAADDDEDSDALYCSLSHAGRGAAEARSILDDALYESMRDRERFEVAS